MTPQSFFNSEKSRIIEEIKVLLRIPSISTREENKPDVQKAADWVQKKLTAIGLEGATQLVVDNGNPVVVAQKVFDEKLPTLLVYGHYDVQPAEPLDEWESKPFEPVERDGALFGRGTTDNKAQFMTNIAALEYYLQHADKKTWNIKVAIEGEEEVGGPSIEKMIAMQEYEKHFKADYAYISDGPWVKSDTPSIEFTLRGLIYFDLEIRVSSADMHSGLFGNVVMNPANLAGYVIYKLKDILANRLRIPNIYKQMRKLNKEEADSIAASSMTWEETKTNSGSFVVTPYQRHGDSFAPAILTGARPSLDVHGILAGFTEKGRLKTVIPATALVKFSLRLVPFMDPDHTVELVEKYIKKIMPKGVEYTLTCLQKGKPYITDPNDVQIEKLKKAFSAGFGKTPDLTTCGGSIGLVTKLDETYGIKSLLASYGLPDDRLHSPNEKYNISQIEGGFKTLTSFLVN